MSLLSKLPFFTGFIGDKNGFLPPLSKAEEEKCLIAAERGDKGARDKLIERNMRLVAHVAKKYSSVGESEDLISVGTIGLIKAVGSYKREYKTNLSTYSARCIENEILMYLRANKKHRGIASLEEAVGSDKEGNELTLMDLLCDENDDVFANAEKSVIRDKLKKFIKERLKEREYEIIKYRYGLEGIPLTQRETALRLKISRSYISRIEKKALEKLREGLNREDFLE